MVVLQSDDPAHTGSASAISRTSLYSEKVTILKDNYNTDHSKYYSAVLTLDKI